MTTATLNDLGVVVDQLGKLMAKIKDLSNQEAELKALLKDSGEPVVEGRLYRATVSKSEVSSADWRAVAEKLEPSWQLVAAHTTESERVALRVVARVRD